MPQDTAKDVAYIKEWLSKEPHLPQDIDDDIIVKFLHSCYSSLGKTKKCMDRFCTTRSVMSEIFTARDPFSPNIQTAFSIAVVSSYQWGDIEILIHKYDDPTSEKYIFYDMLRTITMQGDYWLRRPFLAEGHYIIIDMAHYSLKMLPKTNIMYLRDYVVFLLEGIPIRVKKVFVINTPSFYDKIYALLKPALPPEICDIIHFFPDYQSLHKIIDRKYLPKEYGGEAQSMYEQNQEWLKEIESNRKMYLNENLWKADIKKKPKGDVVVNMMSGSFRTLSID